MFHSSPQLTLLLVRKHPAPEGALRPQGEFHRLDRRACQKAPSTRRCIKTSISDTLLPSLSGVRKHPAPEGALRLLERACSASVTSGQKAPSTRRCIKTRGETSPRTLQYCQKAPSTRRCIKTGHSPADNSLSLCVRKHPAPEGALRPMTYGYSRSTVRSESTQHQKVH